MFSNMRMKVSNFHVRLAERKQPISDHWKSYHISILVVKKVMISRMYFLPPGEKHDNLKNRVFYFLNKNQLIAAAS